MPETTGTNLSIPETLVKQIRDGKVILFLGAGANYGATCPSGDSIPVLGTQLAKKMEQHFFNGAIKDRSLMDVAKFVENDYGLPELQEWVAKEFTSFQPAPHHKRICDYRWHAIATTNYDLIVERAYEQSGSLFEILPFYKNNDRIDLKLKARPEAIPFFKLHGCITKISDTEIPLILTPEQYLKYKSGRERMFNALSGWAQDFCILFVGYSIGDPHVAQILLDLEDNKVSRPAFFSLNPHADEFDIRYWANRKVTILPFDLENFMAALSNQLDNATVALAAVTPKGNHSVSHFFTSQQITLPDDTIRYLSSNAEHVFSTMPTPSSATAKAFYEGADIGWGAITQNLAAPRKVADDVLMEKVISEVDDEMTGGSELVLLKGPAGNGKTIALRQIAWNAAHDYEKFVLYIGEDGMVDPSSLAEIIERTKRRLFIVVDRAALHCEGIKGVLLSAKEKGRLVTIITAERDHEWTTYCGELEDWVTAELQVRYLNEVEIHALLKRLEENNCLGMLAEQTRQTRFEQFSKHAERQLLVALHELTSGRRYEEIIKDEYDRILPDEARYLYLDICTLNRFSVSVRAGVISRVANISFQDFSARLFKPLENVVIARLDSGSRDYTFKARHPRVAEIVFNEVLDTQEKKYDQLIRILAGMNLDFSSDAIAFREIIRSVDVVDAFPNVELAHRFYQQAIEITEGQNASVYQQAAIFELNHKGGDLGRAHNLLTFAREISPHDTTIKHTFANLKRRQALTTKTKLESINFRKEARAVLSELKNRNRKTVYEYHTYAQIALDELKESLEEQENTPEGDNDHNESDTLNRMIPDLVTEAEKAIQTGLQLFSDSPQLHELEAKFHNLLSRSQLAEIALRKAFELNDRREHVAVRLHRLLSEQSKSDEAEGILRRCIESNPSAQLARFELAKTLVAKGDYDADIVIGHLRRSATKGDANYHARFLLAVQLMLTGAQDESFDIFQETEKFYFSSTEKNKIRDCWKNKSGEQKTFSGNVEAMKSDYCFVSVSGIKQVIFAHFSNSARDNWNKIREGSAVNCRIGFTMRGPVATDIFIFN